MEKGTNTKPLPRIVSGAEWQTAHESLLVKVFAGEKARLLDLIEGRTQLIVYHFMFAPTVDGWPDAG